MSKVLVNDTYLSGIASAIRQKSGSSALYKPSEMAAAINAIDTGGITPTGSITITENATVDVAQYASAVVNVPNSYSVGDEGKVVSNGALVSQSSQTVIENGTYDTTTKNEVIVNVSGSASNEWITPFSGVLIERDGEDYLITIQTSTAQGMTYALGISTSEAVRITYVGPTIGRSSGTIQSGTQIKQNGYVATDAIRAGTGRLTYNNHSVGDSYVYASGDYVVYFGVYAGIGGFKFRLSKVTE